MLTTYTGFSAGYQDYYNNNKSLHIKTQTDWFNKDASSNNFAITVNGNARPSIKNPFSGYQGSTYFDGSGSYLTIANNTSLYIASGDFIIEAWIYVTASGRRIIVSQTQNTGSPYDGWSFYITSGNLLRFEGSNGVGLQNSTTFPLNQWVHVAASRVGSTTYLFQNGILITSGSVNIVNFASTFTIGQFTSPVTGSEFSGYISQLRLKKGVGISTNFTPQTTPFVSDANTILLTCQSRYGQTNNFFLDTSSYDLSITRNGNATQGTFGPSTSVSEIYFSGSGDYLQFPLDSNNKLGSGNWTIRARVYLTSLSTNRPIYVTRTGNNYAGIVIGILTTGEIYTLISNNGTTWAVNISTGSKLSINTWYDITVIRSGTTISTYINGVFNYSTSFTGAVNESGGVGYIGFDPGQTLYWNGYISAFEINNTALYTANFTPPTTYTSTVGTKINIIVRKTNSYNNNIFLDQSINAFPITRYGNTTQGTFGLENGFFTGYFDGTGDYLLTPASSVFNLGTSNFTIECWVNTSNTTNCDIFGYYNGTNTAFGFIVGNPYNLSILPGTISVFTETYGVDYLNAPTNTVLTNTWYHIAAVRNGSSLTIYVNGVNVASKTTSVSWGSTQALGIGKLNGSLNRNLNGYLGLFRVSNIARYTANFTPSSSYGADANSLLFLQFNNPAIYDIFNKYNIETVGSVRASSFQLQPATGLYSGYFDGSGDSLQVAHNSAFTMGSGDFTLEFWANFTVKNNTTFLDNGGVFNVTYGNYYINLSTTTLSFYVAQTGSPGAVLLTLTTLTSPSVGAWYHFALVKLGTTYKLFVNGVPEATGTTASVPSKGNTNPLIIAGSGGATSAFNGYLSLLRISNATRYSGPFTPTTNYGIDSNTVLFLPFDNAAIYDASCKNNIETVGGCSVTNSPTRLGQNSIYSTGSTGYIIANPSSNFDLGSGDWTIEGWFRWSSITGYPVLFSLAQDINSTTVYHLISGNNGSGNLSYLINGSGVTGFNTTFAPGINTWFFIMLRRQNGTTQLYANGTLIGSTTNAPTISGSSCRFHTYQNGTTNATVNSYDIRITKGIARPVTTPTAPFPIY